MYASSSHLPPPKAEQELAPASQKFETGCYGVMGPVPSAVLDKIEVLNELLLRQDTNKRKTCQVKKLLRKDFYAYVCLIQSISV